MDDERIRRLSEEVLASLAAPAEPVTADLEARVAALEKAVAGLQLERGTVQTLGPAAARSVQVAVHAHPALQVLNVSSGGERCVLEPDKPCVESGRCRAFGH
jgi:hypothetical protein